MITHERLERFGAQLYSIDTSGCAFAFPLGQCLDMIYDYDFPVIDATMPPPTPAPGDRA